MRTEPTNAPSSIRGVPRRTALLVLAASGGLAMAGCTGDGSTGAGSRAAAPHPLRPVLDTSAMLVAAYTATLDRHPALTGRLAPLRADHREHVRALIKAIGHDPRIASASPSASASASANRSPTSRPTPRSRKAAVAALADAEKRAHHAAEKRCVDAPARYAILIGGICACRASHVQVLR